MDELLKRFDELERLIKNQGLFQKEVLTFNEGCDYCGFMPSHMYKLTSLDTIPHYKPNGKMIFFRRSELDAWLLRNRNTTKEEMQQEATTYLTKRGRVSS
jgi:predicted DNA-binding transcriptional regulator AlpA